MKVQIKRIESSHLAEALPYPSRDANKFTRGKLVVVGGCEDYPGSACLASKAALSAGAGYVECACSDAAVPLVRVFAPSLVVRCWEGASSASLRLDVQDAHHPQACLVGSGMFSDGGFQDDLVSELIGCCAAALILDGGALRTVAERGLGSLLQERFKRGRVSICTPHGGEAAVLGRAAGIDGVGDGASLEEQGSFAQALADAYGSYVLLKGPLSFIASPHKGDVYLMDRGTPALSKAGTGDVLAGIVGAFAAQGVDAACACALAATVHAEAGRVATQRQGIISVTAEDVLASVPCALQQLQGAS